MHNAMHALAACGVGLVACALGGFSAKADDAHSYMASGNADWTGLYVGGQLGGAWSDIDWTLTNANYFNTLGAVTLGNKSEFDASGVAGGVIGGYNYQTGSWLLGVELAATALDVSESHPSPFFPALDTYSTKVTWLTTVAGRVGYAWDRWLVYGRGGWAGGDVKMTIDSPTARIRASKDAWANGWTVGAGTEYMLWPQMSLGLAYDYVDLSVEKAVTCPACGTGVGAGTPIIDSDYKLQSVMVRASYLFRP